MTKILKTVKTLAEGNYEVTKNPKRKKKLKKKKKNEEQAKREKRTKLKS